VNEARDFTERVPGYHTLFDFGSFDTSFADALAKYATDPELSFAQRDQIISDLVASGNSVLRNGGIIGSKVAVEDGVIVLDERQSCEVVIPGRVMVRYQEVSVRQVQDSQSGHIILHPYHSVCVLDASESSREPTRFHGSQAIVLPGEAQMSIESVAEDHRQKEAWLDEVTAELADMYFNGNLPRNMDTKFFAMLQSMFDRVCSAQISGFSADHLVERFLARINTYTAFYQNKLARLCTSEYFRSESEYFTEDWPELVAHIRAREAGKAALEISGKLTEFFADHDYRPLPTSDMLVAMPIETARELLFMRIVTENKLTRTLANVPLRAVCPLTDA